MHVSMQQWSLIVYEDSLSTSNTQWHSEQHTTIIVMVIWEVFWKLHKRPKI